MTCRRAADPRRRYYTLLSVGKKALSWDDDTYRAFLRDHGASDVDGRTSATTMAIGDLIKAVDDMRDLGFRPTRKPRQEDWRTLRIKKAYALWCALYDGGAVRDKRFVAFERWSATQTRTAKLEWADSSALNRVIEGLKSWAGRERIAIEN